jgi:hypothetical protein
MVATGKHPRGGVVARWLPQAAIFRGGMVVLGPGGGRNSLARSINGLETKIPKKSKCYKTYKKLTDQKIFAKNSSKKHHNMKLPVAAHLSRTSLEAAAHILPATKCYELCVPSSDFQYAKNLLREIAGTTHENVFAPYINLKVSPELPTDHWRLHASPSDFIESGF